MCRVPRAVCRVHGGCSVGSYEEDGLCGCSEEDATEAALEDDSVVIFSKQVMKKAPALSAEEKAQKDEVSTER